jgi:hypothetical protein
MTPNTSYATLSGGVSLEVTYEDGTTHEIVLVRQLPVRLLPRYMAIAEDEARSVELFCDKPSGWSDKLAQPSFLAVLTKGEELNLDPLSSYAARAAARREKLMPGITERVLKNLVSASPTTAPGSPSGSA